MFNAATELKLADPEAGTLADVIDLERYPQVKAGPDGWSDLGQSMAADLSHSGIARLPGFVRPEAVAAITEDLQRSLPYVDILRDRRSVYARGNIGGDIDPASLESDWVAGHITRDMIPPQSAAHRLFVSPLFKRLAAAAVGTTQLYEYADPLASLVATVLPPGGCYGWHYDTNAYVITVGITEAERGGRFEFRPNLRSPGDENLQGLADVIAGRDPDIESVKSAPGDLQVFRGRYSLHRVTKVEGNQSRLTLVLSYADRPGVIGPVDRTRRVYGRVTEAHLIAGTLTAADGLIL